MNIHGPSSILLFVGGAYHPFPQVGRTARAFLERTGRYTVEVTAQIDALLHPDPFAVVMLYCCGVPMPPGVLDALESFVERGGGLVPVHCANACFDNEPGYFRLIGSQFDHHPVEHPTIRVAIEPAGEDILPRVGDFDIVDELFFLKNLQPDLRILATTRCGHRPAPMMYTRTQGRGRVFYTALGHGLEQWGHPQFQQTLIRGLDWACGRTYRPGPIRCGSLGCGGWNRHHMRWRAMTPGLTSVAGYDPSGDAREAFRADYPDARVHDTLEVFLGDDQIDLVSLVVPHNRHAELALRCIESGKHVVVEKPFTLTVAEADAVIDAAESAGVMVAPVHNRRWDRDFRTIQRLVRDGVFGEVIEVACGFAGYQRPGREWSWYNAERWWTDKTASGGILWPWIPHVMDWVLQIVPSPVTSVLGFFHKKVWYEISNEDHGRAILRFANGAMGDVFQSDISAPPLPRWRIVGTRGGLIDDGSVPEGCRLYTVQNGRSVSAEMTWDFPADEHHRLYWNIADHLLCGDLLAVTPLDGRRVTAVLEYAERSCAAGHSLELPGESCQTH